jgi:hypothetical protein
MAEDKSTKVLTAPLAIIRIDGQESGFMRNIRVTENIQRAEVKGISNLYLREVPAVGVSCTFTCDFFFISLKRPEMRAFIRRDQGVDVFENTLTLAEKGIEVQLLRKKGIPSSDGKTITALDDPDTIALIVDAFPTSQGFDISENAVSGANMSFQYLTPIFFKD